MQCARIACIYVPTAGQLTLHKLRLKKGALDKFRLPVDVVEGHFECRTISLNTFIDRARRSLGEIHIIPPLDEPRESACRGSH